MLQVYACWRYTIGSEGISSLPGNRHVQPPHARDPYRASVTILVALTKNVNILQSVLAGMAAAQRCAGRVTPYVMVA